MNRELLKKLEELSHVADERCNLAERIEEYKRCIALKQRVLPAMEAKLAELNVHYYALESECDEQLEVNQTKL